MTGASDFGISQRKLRVCDLFNVNKTYESYIKIENLIASSLRGGLDLIARFDLCNGRARMVILFRPQGHVLYM